MNHGTSMALIVLVVWALGSSACHGPDEPVDREASKAAQTSQHSSPQPQIVAVDAVKMGTRFDIQVAHHDQAAAASAIDAAYEEIDRLEELLSEWREDSQISEVNRQAGQGPLSVGPELLEVVTRALELSQLTDGAFDITFATCGHLWSVGQQRIPSEQEIADCLPHIDYRNVVVDQEESTIELIGERTRIGIGAIGKGYGVDRAAQVLSDRGIDDFIVDGGGDLRASGQRFGRPWRAAIAHPRSPDEFLAVVELWDRSFVTSGDYERYFESDGVRYHHIIDPATARPARASIATTVIADDTTTADALSTAFFVLGPTEALAIAGDLPGVEVLLVTADMEVHQTPGMENYLIDDRRR